MSTVELTSPAHLAFDTLTLSDLEQLSAADRDALPFGVIGFTPSGEVDVYNATEARYAGLTMERQIGQSLFNAVAPCMNNFLVAQRFEDEAALDELIPYVLTLRMRPIAVKLRLLSAPDASTRYVLIRRPG